MNVHVLAGLNIVLGLVGFCWLVLRTATRWNEYPWELKLLLAKTMALFFCLLAVSIQLFTTAAGLQVSVVIITATKCFALYTLWKTRGTKYRTGTRRLFQRDVGADPDRDIY